MVTTSELTETREDQDDYSRIVVTAASENHFDIGIAVLLPSLRRYLDPDSSLVVYYDIGLTRSQSQELQDTFPEISYRKFPFENYPQHFSLSQNAGYWAWKPLIIQQLVQKYPTAQILWLDSGNQVTGDLTAIWSFIRQRGVFSQRSSSTMKKYVHPGMFSYMNIDPSRYLKKGNCDGAIVGIDASNSDAVTNILDPWVDCALHKDCIAPEQSSRANHRQDQAALTVLMRVHDLPCRKDEAKQHHIHKHIDNTPAGQTAIAKKNEWRQMGKYIHIVTAAETFDQVAPLLALLRQFANPWTMQVICYLTTRDTETRFPEVEYRYYDNVDQVSILHSIFHDASCEKCTILWLDPSVALDSELDLLLPTFKTQEIWSTCSPRAEHSLTGTETLGLGRQISAKGVCDGQILAFSTAPTSKKVVDAWYECLVVKKESCWDKISPTFSEKDRMSIVLSSLLKSYLNSPCSHNL